MKHPSFKDRQLDHGTSAGEVMIVKHQRYKDRQLDHGTFAGGVMVGGSSISSDRKTNDFTVCDRTTDANSKHWFMTSFLQPLPYLVTP